MVDALTSGNRELSGRTAPGHGLYLVSVRYPEALLAPDAQVPAHLGTPTVDEDDE